jgi:hypothetical protein
VEANRLIHSYSRSQSQPEQPITTSEGSRGTPSSTCRLVPIHRWST